MKPLYIAIAIIALIIIFRKCEAYTNRDCSEVEVFVLDSGIPGPCIGLLAGVHGNEPGPSIALTEMLNAGELRPSRGKVIVVPRANSCGLNRNTRTQPGTRIDINRQFGEHDGMEATSKKLITTFKSCDIVIDFHEGWGFHLDTKHKQRTNPFQQVSLGSSITPSSSQVAATLALKIKNKVNAQITDPLKKFAILWGDSCDIPTTFLCHRDTKGYDHILIEITGQNDIQPQAIRGQQTRDVVAAVWEQYF